MMQNGDLLGVIQLHSDLNRINTSTFTFANNQCSACTMQHGTYITPHFSFGNRTLPDFHDSTLAICSAGNQCVGGKTSTTGCCRPCKDSQVCVKATIASDGLKKADEWNRCPPGYKCDSFSTRLSNVIEKVSVWFKTMQWTFMNATDVSKTCLFLPIIVRGWNNM